jgi:hypothetical protein
MPPRKERVIRTGSSSSGIEVRLTRKGVEIGGFYDHIVGMEPSSLTWDQFDALRAEVIATDQPAYLEWPRDYPEHNDGRVEPQVGGDPVGG